MENKSSLDVKKMELLVFQLIKGAIESPFEFDPNEVEGHDFNVSFDMGFNTDEGLLKADFEVDISTKSKIEQEEAKGHFTFAFIFGIENLRSLVSFEDKEETKPLVDGNLANAIASVTYSTSRGILLTRFQGTALRNFMLPIINPNDLLN